MEVRDLVKADDEFPDGFRFDEVSDGSVPAGAERFMLGFVEDLADERLQYNKELIIGNFGDWLTQVRRSRRRLGDHTQ